MNKFNEQLYAAQVQGTIVDGRKVVTTAGTRVTISAMGVNIRKVTICALSTNTDVVVIGAVTCIASASTRRGLQLLPGASVEVSIDDLGKLYMDSVVSGEGVTYAYTV